MGVNDNPQVVNEQKIIPIEKNNLKLMSFGFISGNQAPVVWRGPLVAKMTEQFFKDVSWGEKYFGVQFLSYCMLFHILRRD